MTVASVTISGAALGLRARAAALSSGPISSIPTASSALTWPGMRATRANFEISYQRACRDGIFRRGSLIVGASRRGILYLRNFPDANVASISSFSVRGARGHDGTGIEYPFVTADGVLHVPTADELHEAIFCRVVGATAREQEEEGRCLPD